MLTRIALLSLCLTALVGAARAALPDLIVNEQKLYRTLRVATTNFDAGDCELTEGCARAAGDRRLLIFDVGMINIGKGDLYVGDPAARPDLFQISECHGHYHMTGFAVYRVLRYDGSLVTRSHKQGFCFRDDVRYLNTSRRNPRYTCDNQGISAGWQDIYDQSVECQWIDITGVRPGNYYLQIHLNPRFWVREANYNNNITTIPIRIR